MYTIKVFVNDIQCNTLFVDDWKVVRDSSWRTAAYLLMIHKSDFVGYRESLYICQNWGFKAFDEDDNLICIMGKVDGGWFNPHVTRAGDSATNVLELYIDEYADQPDAI